MNELGPKCDFCSAPEPTWAYPARDFVAYLAIPVVGESVGAWTACEECHRLIEAGNREGLAVRSLDELVMQRPEIALMAPELKERLSMLHNLFFANRVGTAIRTAPEAA